jgi:Holliday junction DNA helicase RuvB
VTGRHVFARRCDGPRSHDRDVITREDANEAFRHLQIDRLGLDKLDRSYLRILAESGPTALGELSSKLSLPARTIQTVVEPYLLKEGFITKGKSSLRTVTEMGKRHIESASSTFLNV